MDSLLITLAIVAITALSSWLQKKGKAEEPGSLEEEWKTVDPRKPERPSRPVPPRPSTSPGAPPPRRATAFDWEKELRRLLEGETPASPPPSPPPPVVQRPSPPAAPPLIFPSSETAPARRTISARPEAEPKLPLTTLAESTPAYQKAQQLHETVAGRLHQVDALTHLHSAAAPKRITKVSPEIASATSLLRTRHTIRQAIIASLILGPPKALEN